MAEYRVSEKEAIEKDENNADKATLLKDTPEFIKGEAEINDKLSNLLALLEQKRYHFEAAKNTLENGVDKISDGNTHNNEEVSISANVPLSKPSEDNFELLQQVRDAYCKSIYGNRSYDATGKVNPKFGFLVKPTKHLVSLQVDEVDIILKDDLSLAETFGCMNFFNAYNFYYTITRFTLFLLITPWLSILGPCIIAGFYTPGSELGVLFMVLWNVTHITSGIWMIAYIFCYGHIETMKVIMKANPVHAFWLIGSSISYTISSIMYSPTIYNIPAVINMSLIQTVHKFLFGSTIVFFKLRTTRENYEFYFVPKGCFAKLWLFLDSEEIIADVLRHLAILYSVQASLEAQGKNVLDQESLVGLTIAGKAFQVTLRQVMNTSYTVSLLFRFSGILQGILKGDLGKRIQNVPGRKIVNIR